MSWKGFPLFMNYTDQKLEKYRSQSLDITITVRWKAAYLHYIARFCAISRSFLKQNDKVKFY